MKEDNIDHYDINKAINEFVQGMRDTIDNIIIEGIVDYFEENNFPPEDITKIIMYNNPISVDYLFKYGLSYNGKIFLNITAKLTEDDTISVEVTK